MPQPPASALVLKIQVRWSPAALCQRLLCYYAISQKSHTRVAKRTRAIDHPKPTLANDSALATTDLFAWSGDEVVLLAQREGDRWICARGWREDDRLVDVRRWTFATPLALANQVRRLAREATGNHLRASDAAVAALAWTALAIPSDEPLAP